MYGFPGHHCNQEQNVSPNFAPIVEQCKWSSLSRKIVGIRKCCYYGNPTSKGHLHDGIILLL